MLALVGGDTERLLHQTVWLVAIAIWASVGVVLRSHHAVAVGILVETGATTLAFHFTIGEKASRYSTRAPGFAVSPSSHASFAFIPDKDRARLDGLSFLFGQAALHAWEKSYAACLEKDDSICWRAHMAVVRLHAVHFVVGEAKKGTTRCEDL